jgi:hypothetical protein
MDTATPAPPKRKRRKVNPRSARRTRCDCGNFARYKIRLHLLRPDLFTRLDVVLYLCESCYRLEQDDYLGRGRIPPQATRLG